VQTHRKSGKVASGLILLIFALLFPANTALAHKVMIFAWADGDTVHTESKFSGGKKVRGGEIIVSDPEGNKLVIGKTDDEGEFSFKIPKKTSLKIEVIAGMGHRGEWTLPAEELGDVGAAETPRAEPSVPETETVPKQEQAVSETAPVTVEAQKENPPVSFAPLKSEDIQSAVEKALDNKLKPVMKLLAESREQKPSLRDILGGIGYILGLMGIAAYFNSRKKK